MCGISSFPVILVPLILGRGFCHTCLSRIGCTKRRVWRFGEDRPAQWLGSEGSRRRGQERRAQWWGGGSFQPIFTDY